MTADAQRVVPAAHNAAVAALAMALNNYTQAVRQPGEQPVVTLEARDANSWDPMLYAAAPLSEAGAYQLADELQTLTRARLNTIEKG